MLPTYAFWCGDQPNAYCIERAKNHNVPVFAFKAKEFTDKAHYETEICRILKNLRH
ncbi:MAG: hypothetical protein ACOX0S_08625 [Paludibacteraceae bacterium]